MKAVEDQIGRDKDKRNAHVRAKRGKVDSGFNVDPVGGPGIELAEIRTGFGRSMNYSFRADFQKILLYFAEEGQVGIQIFYSLKLIATAPGKAVNIPVVLCRMA